MDELAHSNLVGGEPRRVTPKRWQDVEELLNAGINVWTTVNVQHIESLNDLVAPDLGRASARDDSRSHLSTRPMKSSSSTCRRKICSLVCTPARSMSAGKRRRPSIVSFASRTCWPCASLPCGEWQIASKRLLAHLQAAPRAGDSRAIASWWRSDRMRWPSSSCGLASAWPMRSTPSGPSFTSRRRRLLRLSEVERNRRIDLLRLAESLGGETVTLDGPSAAAVIAEYAPTRHATRVLVGASLRRGWRAWLRPSTASQLMRLASGFDVIVVAPADRGPPQTRSATNGVQRAWEGEPVRWNRYAWGLATTAICTALALLIFPFFEPVNIAMVYLLGVVIAGVRFGRGPSVLTAILNVAVFDFCFVPPRNTFAVSDAQYLVTFAVMLTVALVTANLMASVRRQTRVAGARERRTALLYAMSRELAATRGMSSMAQVAVRHVAEVFQCQAVVLLPDSNGKLVRPRDPPLEWSFRRADLAVAQWVADHGTRAGLGTDTLPAAPGLYVPLGDQHPSPGVLAVLPENPRRVLLPEQRHLLETFAGQIGLALERARLAEVAEASRVEAESESLRNTLLASISHDLRTPLSVIAGAGSTLAEHGQMLDEATRMRLARSVEAKAREMSDLVSNVLDLMRFESGKTQLRRDWQTLDDLVGTALSANSERLAHHPVDVRLPAELAAVHVDATLIVQVLSNLLDNAAKYTRTVRTSRSARRWTARWFGFASTTKARACRWVIPQDCSRVPARWRRGHGRRCRPGARDLPRHSSCARRRHRSAHTARWWGEIRIHAAGRIGEVAVTQAMHQVLVIEDEPEIRNVVRVLLETERYRVVEAENARRGEIEARARKPDLLLVDLGLPDGDGIALIRRVREWSSVPIIVLSARTMEEQKVAALDAGADDYVTKPFGAPELLARVRAALRRNVRNTGRRARHGPGRRALRSRASGSFWPTGAGASRTARISCARMFDPQCGSDRDPG